MDRHYTSLPFESESKQARWKIKRQEKLMRSSNLRRNVFEEKADESPSITYTMKALNSMAEINSQLQKLKVDELLLLKSREFE